MELSCVLELLLATGRGSSMSSYALRKKMCAMENSIVDFKRFRRHLAFCLGAGLLEISSIKDWPGRYEAPARYIRLSEKGEDLLNILKGSKR